MFSTNLRQALWAVSQDVACDLAFGGDDADVVAEASIGVIEVLRPEVRPELTRLVDEHGYKAVLAEAAKHVGTL
jgi:hypothetical protein